MRLLAASLALALVLSGCLASTQPLKPQGAPALPAAVVAFKADAPVPLGQVPGLRDLPKVVEQLVGDQGAEPNIGVTKSGAVFVTAFDDVMRSKDGGRSWEKAYTFGDVNASPLSDKPIRDDDPFLYVDPATSRIFVPEMWPVLTCAEGIWSDDDGATWFDRPLDCGLPGIDHQKLAAGPYVNNSPLKTLQLPTSTYPNVVYFCYNDVKAQALQQGSATRCAMSTDGGMTYPVDVQIASGAQCGGINGNPVAAANGTVFVPLGLDCGQPWVARSFDNGMSWEALELHVGGLGSGELDNRVSVTPDGTSYYFWRAATDHRVYLVSSKDAFSHVGHPVVVSPPDITSTRFVAMTSGDDGKLAFAYLGTRDSPGTAGDVYDDARWYLFETYTMDAESSQPTFVTTQVTPADQPVQIGYSWEGGGGDPARNLLDFIDMVTGPDGKPYVVFTDGCTKDCDGNASATKDDSRARDIAVAIQDAGPLLHAPTAAAPAKAAQGLDAPAPAPRAQAAPPR